MPGRAPLADLAAVSAVVGSTSSRTAKSVAIAELLRRTRPDEAGLVVRYLSGELRQRRTGLGPAALRSLPAPAAEPSLLVREVDEAFQQMSELAGSGSTGARRQAFGSLSSRATAAEQHFLAALVGGELRQGAQAGVMLEAVARAAAIRADDLRTAVTLSGSLPDVAAAVLADGAAGLVRFHLVVGRPLRPMLASAAPSVAAAMQRVVVPGGETEAAVEWKLDGIRVQVHRQGGDVAVFTRTLDDVTARVPELVHAALALPAHSAVIDGEALALRPGGRPRPFQETGRRLMTRVDVAAARAAAPLEWIAFDALHVDGEDLVGRGGQARWRALEQATGLLPARTWDEHDHGGGTGARLVPRTVTGDVAAAATVLAEATAAGHEGVVLKALDAPYQAGRRGAAWVKVKPRHTLDLVVLAAEWGHGRRRGWLSNLHLGARDPDGRYGPPGGFVMLGKTFKGLTDAMLADQTAALLALADGDTDGWVVHVRPGFVVEVAFDGVQTSPRYPAGMALRFARVLRHRADKAPADVDTVDAVAAARG